VPRRTFALPHTRVNPCLRFNIAQAEQAGAPVRLAIFRYAAHLSADAGRRHAGHRQNPHNPNQLGARCQP